MSLLVPALAALLLSASPDAGVSTDAGVGAMRAAHVRNEAALKAAPAARPEDVKSLDALMAALYGTISGPAGAPRDWNRLRSLFHPGA